MKTHTATTHAIILIIVANVTGVVSAATLIGPTQYLSAANSPFNLLDFGYFHLEDFEDQLLNVPGVIENSGSTVTSLLFDESVIDSVDADDGVIDGSGSNGDSLFNANGSIGISFTFDEVALGSLPTHVGIVWTDGAGSTMFQAFDANGSLIGSIGPVTIATSGTSGETDEDSFFGAMDSNGIASITISNSSGGIEVDHLQYGSGSAPDSDGDGIEDSLDNCTVVANPDQVDTDSDGYGNSCDADYNNDCLVNFLDLAQFSNEFLGTDPLFDANGDGAVNFLDFSIVTLLFLQPPGPGLGGC